ncbi:MAG: hypothetical protein Q4B67_07485 [Eubacteriales bacterium]|nr:hypothetical protein [Eubacteriales bacterium]
MRKNIKYIMMVGCLAALCTACANASKPAETAVPSTEAETTVATTEETTTVTETEATVTETEAATENAEILVLKKDPDYNAGIMNMPLGMYLSVNDYDGKEQILYCTIKNQTGADAQFGAEYYLQKEVNGEWQDVEAVSGYGWNKMLYMLKDREEMDMSFNLSFFDIKEPGRYKLLRSDCEAEFELIPESAAAEMSSVIGMANPMVETDANGLMETLGLSFNVPEGAEDVSYFILNDKIAEVQFRIPEQEMHVTARTMSANEFEDISGMYYNWTDESDGKVFYNDAKIKHYHDDKKDIQVCLWYDVAPGLMYSVVAEQPDADGFDIQGLAESLCPSVQGNVG